MKQRIKIERMMFITILWFLSLCFSAVSFQTQTQHHSSFRTLKNNNNKNCRQSRPYHQCQSRRKVINGDDDSSPVATSSTSSATKTNNGATRSTNPNNNNNNNNVNNNYNTNSMNLSGDTARAGQDGYSLLRQPLQRDTWDTSKDPRFQAPKGLVEKSRTNYQDSEWWSSRQQQQQQQQQGGGRTSSLFSTSQRDRTGYDSDVSRQPNSFSLSQLDDSSSSSSSTGGHLNLFQRSFDTLDFPLVLRALRAECCTIPGKRIVDEAGDLQFQMNNQINNNKDKVNGNGNINTVRKEPLMANDSETVQDRYRAVLETQWLLDHSVDLGDAYYKNRRGYQVTLGRGNPPPLEGHLFDLDSILQIVEEGQILGGPELLDISMMMNAMEDLQLWSKGLEYATVQNREPPPPTPSQQEIQQQQQQQHEDNDELRWFVELPKIIQGIQINTTLQTLLEEAFDTDGRLSGKTFPILGELRGKVRTLKADILRTLDRIVELPSVRSKLALESGGPLYSEVSSPGGGCRLVLPIDPKYASDVGIVHDSSRSGKTVYVEPTEIVSPTNELRQLERQLEAEEAKVWRSLTEQVWSNRMDLQASVHAVAQLDLCFARCTLGRRLKGVIPIVQNEGVIALQDAKHPVLLLRKAEQVVGSDVNLGAAGNQGLVLTGPNAGGKTVILKLLGLVALMARCGIPIPASPTNDDLGYQPRVDFFNPVLADIGDIQSVDGDLSTFSGHLLVCREVLALATAGKNALVLMDELGSGTDPAQGVAIAQAVLEALMETGCRVAITTHYMALKQLASSDSRFSVAGMQFVRGRPTYRLLPGVVGESYALAVAEKLQLPKTVIDRATELLDSDTRQMGDLIRNLEDQKALIEEQVAEIEDRKREIAAMEVKMKEEQIRLEKQMLTARRDEANKFAKKLEQKEQILEDVLAKLKSDPSKRVVAKSWEEIKFVKRDAINDAENVPSVVKAKMKAARAAEEAKQELVPLAEIRNRPILNEGYRLMVCKSGALFGREAIVTKDLSKQLQVQVSGLAMSMKHTDLAMVPADESGKSVGQSKTNIQGGKSRLSKSVERALMSEGKASSKSPSEGQPSNRRSSPTMRMDANTVDVRGCNLEEAQTKVRDMVSKCLMNGQSTVYVLHGHGSGGVLKTKLREWLKSEKHLVKKWAPAEQANGGDAFTQLQLT